MNAKYGKWIGRQAVLAALAVMPGLPACSNAVTGEDAAGWLESAQAIIRQRNDPARGRLWVLTRDGMDVYDSVQRRKLAHVEVPGWQWVHEPYACPPDFALGPKGEVVITSNVMATLWRVDSESFAISRHDLDVDPGSGREFGFGSLTYSRSRGAYYAVGAFDSSVWRIDPQLQIAREPALTVAPGKACGLDG